MGKLSGQQFHLLISQLGVQVVAGGEPLFLEELDGGVLADVQIFDYLT